MTRMVFAHTKSLICMNTTTKKRSNAAKIGWIRHDLAALKRSYASAKGWDTRRQGQSIHLTDPWATQQEFYLDRIIVDVINWMMN